VKRIFVNGTFDIIHRGHIEILNYAKSLGDYLIVAIDTDERVKRLKGVERPIYTLCDRLFHLKNIKSVDEATSFNTDEELFDLVRRCDIIVKGSDYRNRVIPEQEYCKQLIYYDRTEHSTTKTIQHIIDRR
jgi:D-beta-D-heptose 7-phosphate kinase/D-beta-D-heptose 1-phosphate adenosyltransferase